MSSSLVKIDVHLIFHSVSSSVIPNAMNYIKNQQEHHRVKTFAEEYLGFLNAYGIEYNERYIFND